MTTTLDERTFDEEIASADKPVLVDFWAEWCQPCRMIAPILSEIAEEQAERLRVAKVNVDENPSLARRFGVQSIPTLILFKDGREVTRVVGAVPKRRLLEDLAEHI
ncbi:MAG: thioredoxin [Acidimicrobiales bacterium]|nr:MAG: thioredoxin [Acidimicrobiales bacterium]